MKTYTLASLDPGQHYLVKSKDDQYKDSSDLMFYNVIDVIKKLLLKV